MPAQEATPPFSFSTLADALRGELEQLKKQRQETTLFSGEYLRTYAAHHYYRFEISEDLLLRGVEQVVLTLGTLEPVELPAKIISLENQFLTVAVPVDFGPVIPEMKCRWSYDDWLNPIIRQLSSLDGRASLAQQLLSLNGTTNQAPQPFALQTPPTTPPDQQATLQKIMQNRVTMLWGPVLTGKTHLLALLAVNYVKAGKKVLFVAPTSERVDDTLANAVTLGTELGVDMLSLSTRVGLPLYIESELTTKLSFEHHAEEAKKQIFQERFQLLEEYWRVKVKQILNEDYYVTLDDVRVRAAESKKQLDQVTPELNAAREQLKTLESASMFEKMKKNYKDDLALSQKRVAEKQAAQKRLQTLAGTLSNQVLKLEAQAPVRGEELKAFQSTVKRIEDLGGVEKIRTAMEESGLVNEEKIFASKKLIGTTLSTALASSRVRDAQFDLIMVDDAEVIHLPSLAVLAARTKEKLVVVGDPFQVDPESVSNNELAQTWLQRDIFMHAAQTEDLHRLFEWSQQNDQWSVFLSTQFATTPKLSLFIGSILFDDKLNVLVSPNARGKIYFLDTSSLKSQCQQYIGRKKMLPYNEPQARKTVECVKHALMEPQRRALDVGVITPFQGPTLYLKLILRLQGIKNVEVGTPQSFRGRRKKTIIFDTTMAGVDYTMRPMDDRKVGEQKIASLLNTVFSCAGEDLYVLADMAHLQARYKDRLFTKLLMLLQTHADPLLNLLKAVKQFDELEWDKRAPLFDVKSHAEKTEEIAPQQQRKETSRVDAELALRMKMLE
ncbi:MAG: AAA domain-containing protein, partial [Bacteroidota bacterium]